MRKKYHNYNHNKLHSGVAFGIFLVTLGIALLIATNDLFNLGSISDYFTWRTAMIYIGVLLFLNLEFTGGIFLVAGGIWFMRDELFPFSGDKFDIFFWPAVIGLTGISFILSSIFRKKINQ